MTRWRPPQPRQSAYITPAGYAALKEELRVLWKERRPEATRKVAEAAALGDRSENADYIYGKRLLAEIDRRVRYLTKRLDDLTVVDRAPDDPGRVWFGARVTLEAGDGTERTWRIVGPDEIGPSGWISIDAPLARALLGRRRDDEVAIPSAAGPPQTVAISAIDYDFPAGSDA